MKRHVLIAIALTVFVTNTVVYAQWRSKTHDVYNALTIPPGVDIKVGDFSEYWEGVFETVKGTDGEIFCGVEYSGNVFQEHNGGKWKGPDDHQTCFAILWDPEAIYISIAVNDDEHEHAAAAAWNGDGAQLALEMSGKRSSGLPMWLYNIGLDDKAKDILPGALNENPGGEGIVPGEDVAVVRNEAEKETYYEVRFTAEELQVKGKKFSEGFKFGLGICVNDGDREAGQEGQKGWSGWYTHSIVFGKNSEHTGLVVLTNEVLAVEASHKLATTWGTLKSVR